MASTQLSPPKKHSKHSKLTYLDKVELCIYWEDRTPVSLQTLKKGLGTDASNNRFLLNALRKGIKNGRLKKGKKIGKTVVGPGCYQISKEVQKELENKYGKK